MTIRERAVRILCCPAAMGIVAVIVGLTFAIARAVPNANSPTQTGGVDEARRQADQAAAKLTETLMKRLTAAIEEGGILKGVQVCSEVAQDVTRDVGKDQDVVVRRTSLKNRNPANVPDPFEREWLERAEGGMKAGQKAEPLYVVKERSDGKLELRHLRPIIYPGGLCNECHGMPEEISPEASRLLRERYPDDRATGFRAGNLRGAISVRVGLPERSGSQPGE